MKIAICDDEEVFLRKLQSELNNMLSGTDFLIDCYTSGNSLLSSYTERKYDIVIHDIEMKGMNGIETAEKIRLTDRYVTIAFLTSYEEFAIAGYNVKAERYILKQQPEFMYEEQLKGLINDYSQNHKKFSYSNNNVAFSILLSDIVFFEVFNRSITIHTVEEEYTYYGKLSELVETYKDDGFIKVGKSYLINAAFIKIIKKNDIQLKTGQTIELGRKVKNQVVEEYFNYLSGK